MARDFRKKYKSLVLEQEIKPRRLSVSNNHKVDPWVGKKPHAKNGFVNKFCKEH